MTNFVILCKKYSVIKIKKHKFINYFFMFLYVLEYFLKIILNNYKILVKYNI